MQPNEHTSELFGPNSTNNTQIPDGIAKAEAGGIAANPANAEASSVATNAKENPGSAKERGERFLAAESRGPFSLAAESSSR